MEKFDTETVQTLYIPVKNVQWIKKGKEVLVAGKYFDVKSYTTAGDTILLTGYFDQQEDRLADRIKNIFQQKNNPESSPHQTAVTFLFYPIFIGQVEISIVANWTLLDLDFLHYSELIPEAPFPTFIQPPQLS